MHQRLQTMPASKRGWNNARQNQAIDQAILPKSHLLHHSTSDAWHKLCTTCRAGLQRRKAARAGSTDLEVRQIPHASFGAGIRLDTEDCHLEAVDEQHVQYYAGARYDLIAVDNGMGWNFSEPIADKRTSTVKHTMRLARSADENYKTIASDSAGEFCKAARQFDMDFVPSVPYRSTTNPIERIIQTFGDRRRNCMVHAGATPLFRPFATRWAAAVHNLFVPVVRYHGVGDQREAVTATPQVHRHGVEHARWTEDNFPLFGQALTVVLPKELQSNARRTQARGSGAIFLYQLCVHGKYSGAYVVALLEPLIMRGQLRALATLDVEIPPGAARFPMKEMLRAAEAMRHSKQNINSMMTDENFYHDVMFEIGTGAGAKSDVDITSQFSLLPDAHIQSEAVLNCLDDLGHATNANTPRPHARERLASFFSPHSMDIDDPPVEPMPTAPPVSGVAPPAVADETEAAALREWLRLSEQYEQADSYGAGENAKGVKCRRRRGSRRPSDILPEAWANMGAAQKDRAEESVAARRVLLRS